MSYEFGGFVDTGLFERDPGGQVKATWDGVEIPPSEFVDRVRALRVEVERLKGRLNDYASQELENLHRIQAMMKGLCDEHKKQPSNREPLPCGFCQEAENAALKKQLDGFQVNVQDRYKGFLEEIVSLKAEVENYVNGNLLWAARVRQVEAESTDFRRALEEIKNQSSEPPEKWNYKDANAMWWIAVNALQGTKPPAPCGGLTGTEVGLNLKMDGAPGIIVKSESAVVGAQAQLNLALKPTKDYLCEAGHLHTAAEPFYVYVTNEPKIKSGPLCPYCYVAFHKKNFKTEETKPC